MKSITNIKFVFIFTFLISCNLSCVVKQNQKIVNKYDSEMLTSNFIDSLKNLNIDTILYFSNKCIGCINGNIETNYIFWKEDNTTKVIRFDSHLGRQEAKECNDIFNFYTIDNLTNETLNKPALELSHYHYYRLKLISKNSFVIDVPEYYLEVNNEKYISNWIYRIESTLFRIKN